MELFQKIVFLFYPVLFYSYGSSGGFGIKQTLLFQYSQIREIVIKVTNLFPYFFNQLRMKYIIVNQYSGCLNEQNEWALKPVRAVLFYIFNSGITKINTLRLIENGGL